MLQQFLATVDEEIKQGNSPKVREDADPTKEEDPTKGEEAEEAEEVAEVAEVST
jgi:hypothetical protein